MRPPPPIFSPPPQLTSRPPPLPPQEYFVKFALINDPSKMLPLAQGYGFATFCEFTAFLLALSASVIISPWVTGTFQEKTILRTKKALELP